MWPHLSTSLKLLQLRDIAEMQLLAKFLRGTQVWPICILQILKILVTEKVSTHNHCQVMGEHGVCELAHFSFIYNVYGI